MSDYAFTVEQVRQIEAAHLADKESLERQLAETRTLLRQAERSVENQPHPQDLLRELMDAVGVLNDGSTPKQLWERCIEKAKRQPAGYYHAAGLSVELQSNETVAVKPTGMIFDVHGDLARLGYVKLDVDVEALREDYELGDWYGMPDAQAVIVQVLAALDGETS